MKKMLIFLLMTVIASPGAVTAGSFSTQLSSESPAGGYGYHLASSGLPEAWVSRGEAVAVLAAAGALLALFFSVASALLRRPQPRQDVLVLGGVSMLLSTGAAVAVVRAMTSPGPELGPWGAAALTLLGFAATGLLLRRVLGRVRTVFA